MNQPNVQSAISRGLRYVVTASDVGAPPLVQALVLEALQPFPQAAALVKQLAARLAREALQLLENGSLVEAFKVLQVLHSYDASQVSGHHLAAVSKRLIASEVQPGGPYAEKQNQPCLASNACINRFVTAYSQPLPAVGAYLEEAFTAENQSAFTPLFTFFLVAGSYHGSQRARLQRIIAQQPCRTTLDSTLQHLGRQYIASHQLPIDATTELLSQQRGDGSWPAGSIYLSGAAASAMLTTALALQALAQAWQPTTSSRLPSNHAQAAIFQRARQSLSRLSPPLKQLSLEALDQVRRADTNGEIALLPQFFQVALQPSAADQRFTATLGEANVFLWLAYTIYDDFLDEEGTPLLLSVANVAMRFCLERYREIMLPQDDFEAVVRDAFDTMDNANTWELKHCRFKVQDNQIEIGRLPRYGQRAQLADRSFAHLLGPVALLISHGLPVAHHRHQLIVKALRHYLIARQLNDDIHDWRKDLRAGHISSTVATLLEASGVRPGSHQLSVLLPRLEQHFWQDILQKQCETVLQHARMARRLLQKSGVVALKGSLLQLFLTIEQPAKDALAEHSQQKTFLATYKS